MSNTMMTTAELHIGDSLTSANGRYSLDMQRGGNLVLYNGLRPRRPRTGPRASHGKGLRRGRPGSNGFKSLTYQRRPGRASEGLLEHALGQRRRVRAGTPVLARCPSRPRLKENSSCVPSP